MPLRTVLASIVIPACLGVLVAPAHADTSAPVDLLVPADVLADLDLVPLEGATTELPEDPNCRHLVAARENAASGPTPATTTSQRSATEDDRVQLINSARVFPTVKAARSYQRTFLAEDPTEECFEAFLVSQQGDDDGDIRADDRGGVRLDGAVTVAYLAGANFDDDEFDVKAEALIARKGEVVLETFFLAADDDGFPTGARRIQRALTSLFRDLDA